MVIGRTDRPAEDKSPEAGPLIYRNGYEHSYIFFLMSMRKDLMAGKKKRMVFFNKQCRDNGTYMWTKLKFYSYLNCTPTKKNFSLIKESYVTK